MAIKKRTAVPKGSTPHVTYEPDKENEARHPMLQSGLWRDVYQFVDSNPDCTRKDVAKGLSLPNNVATARVKELIDEGFLFEPPGKRKINPSGVRARCLRVTDRRQGGKPLDKVSVEVTLTIDCNGIYGVEARVIDGMPQSSTAASISKKRLTLTAPHPDTYMSAFEGSTVTHVSRMEVERYADDIIDAEIIE